jgi:hypothetical protein
MSRVEGWCVFSALVGGLSVVSSIENPIISSLPEQFLTANILRGGFNDTGPAIVRRTTSPMILFLLLLPNLFILASLLSLSFLSL